MANETIDITVDAMGNIIRYYCSEALANNVNLIDIYVPYAYELLYDCSVDSSQSIVDGIEVIEESIVVKIQNQYLSDPIMCLLPQPLWIAAIDSRPADNYIPSMDCTSFNVTPGSDQCCAVIQGNLTMTNLSSVDDYMNEVLGAVSTALIESDGAAGYQVDYLGADLGYVQQQRGSDNVGAALNSDMPELPPNDSEFTILGVFVVVFLALTVCGTTAFLIQRQRRLNELTYIIKHPGGDDDSGMEMEEDDEDDWIEPRRLPTREPNDTTKLLTGDDSLDIYIRSISSQPFREPHEVADEDDAEAKFQQRFESAYCFDTIDVPSETEHQRQSKALIQKSDHSNRRKARYKQQQQQQHPYSYAIGGISAVPAFPGDSSDTSEIDSWAQTEGTIGSLEERESGY